MNLLKVTSVKDAKVQLNNMFRENLLKIEVVSLMDSVRRILAEDVVSDLPSPSFPKSTVDGYAAKAKDIGLASESIPSFLTCVGTVEMGANPDFEIQADQCAYVPTGGMVPEGGDTMVMIEYTDHLDETTIAINKGGAVSENIMQIGDDYEGNKILKNQGTKIRPVDIGILAGCGLEKVPVYKKPVISIISTGDELVPLGQSTLEGLKKGKVRDINSYTIGALCRDLGAELGTIEIVKDQWEALREAGERALEISDILLISGGSSAGEKDMTAQLVNHLGDPGVFIHGLAVKPGKPTIMGKAGEKPLFGLPGHPLSAMMVFNGIIKPFIQATYLNFKDKEKILVGTLDSKVPGSEGRQTYQLVKVSKVSADMNGKKEALGYRVTPLYSKSGAVLSIANSDGFMVIDENTEGLLKGQPVEVVLW